MEEKAMAREAKLAMASSSGVMKRGATSSNGQKRHSMGRQKIPIRRIQNEEARQVLIFFFIFDKFFCIR